MHATQVKLIQWASRCSFAIGDYFDLCKPFLFENPRIDPKLQFVLSQLAISCHLTSESAFLLIGNVKLWDTDILIRAVVEGTFKFAFLCSGTESERPVRLRQYWDDLPETTRLKRHQRVEEFLTKVENPDADEWKPLKDSLLEPEELEALRAKYPRKVRQQLEQKWSFNEIAQALSKPDIGPPGFEAVKSMAFSYGMASHLVHQDADAISIIWDRNQREPDRFESIQEAHAARGISDLIIMAMIRALMTFKVHNEDAKPVNDLFRSHQELLNDIRKSEEEWRAIEYGRSNRT